ncbi:MAG: hypothetical protein VKK04_08330 [Synechococcales bacterium]|nr:hypothetical protein [Synechococcales bacterium]
MPPCPHPPMPPADPIAIQAFTTAIPQLEPVLPDDLRQAAHSIGKALTQKDLEGATEAIFDLVERHDCLKEPFTAAYERLDKQHQLHQGRPWNHDVVALSSADLPLEAISASILTADDFVAAGKQLLRRLESRHRRVSDDNQAFLASLHRSIERADEQVLPILRALEPHPLTMLDLAHVLGHSLDQIRPNVYSLWRTHYIDLTTSSLVHRILPILPRLRNPQPVTDTDSYFTLTMKGHFRLHPLITARH